MKIKTSRKPGFTLIETMIAVGLVGLLAAIAAPNYAHARKSSRQSACINNLRMMDAAMQTFARDNRKLWSEPIQISDIEPYIHLTAQGTLPPCPAGGTYSVDIISNGPSCNISGHVLQ